MVTPEVDLEIGPDEDAEATEPPTGSRHLLSIRNLLVVGAVVAVIAFTWRFGGGKATFNVEATGDPNKKFDWGFFFALIPEFAKALWVDVQATIGGITVAATFGLLLALGRRSIRRWVRWPVAFFIEFVRSTPLLIQLFFLFFALPTVTWLPESVRVMGPLQTLIIGLGIHYGTYCSEAYRAGIDSVPDGQWEASTAMNLTPLTTWTRVVLPQAIPNVLPALGNYLVAGFKDAPLGSSIQVTGVLFFARTEATATFRPTELFTMVGVGFLLVSIPAGYLIRQLERRIGYDRT